MRENAHTNNDADARGNAAHGDVQLINAKGKGEGCLRV